MESGALERFTGRLEYIRLLPRAGATYRVLETTLFLTDGRRVLPKAK